jgi:inosose dehydratase
MSVRIGINPLTWSNDDLPSLGADTPLDVCLKEGRLAGYSGFELGNKFPRDPDELAKILNQHELKLVSGWFSGQLLTQTVEEELDSLSSHLNLLSSLGATTLVYCEVTGCIHGEQQTPLSKRPRIAKDQWPEFGRRLTKVAKHCLNHGVRLSYHHHMGTVIQDEQDIDDLMKHTEDSLGLLLDTGHLTYAGADPLAIQRRYATRVSHVHCKDIRETVLLDAKNRNLSFLDAVLNGVFTVPGDGCIDYLPLFKSLNKSDYQGWFVVEAEQDPSVAKSFYYAELGRNNLQQLCNNAGLIIEA